VLSTRVYCQAKERAVQTRLTITGYDRMSRLWVVTMDESQILLAAAALLIAAIMLPIPSSVRGVFFVLLGGFYLLAGFGLGLRQIGSMFN